MGRLINIHFGWLRQMVVHASVAILSLDVGSKQVLVVWLAQRLAITGRSHSVYLHLVSWKCHNHT